MLNAAPPPDPASLFSTIELAGRESVIAAVSGGGDSLALLLLLDDHLKTLHPGPKLVAVTVDHGLRPEAAGEARAVALLCAGRNIAHRVKRWEGPKPRSGVPAAAREARMRLLAEAAGEAGTDLILTGHTADDQAETLAMRLARGEGRGAAGIAPATLHERRVWFVRPLLATRRSALRAYLGARGVGWMEDPSNSDGRFERARVRGRLGEDETGRLLAKARDGATAREDAGARAALLISHAAARPAAGLLSLSLPRLDEAEEEIARYVLRIMLAVAGGAQHLPEEQAAAQMMAQMREGFRGSLSRAVATVRRGRVYLHREDRNLPSLPLSHGVVWDGRYRVAVAGAPGGLSLAAFGAANAREAELGEAEAPAGLVRAALAAEPALWRDTRCIGPAAADGAVSLEAALGPWERLLPSFDLSPARALAGVLGGDPPPPPPLRGHKGHIR